MNTDAKIAATVWAYVIAAILTAGYAANAEHRPVTRFMGEHQTTAADDIFIGFICGIGWPMYLSYKAFGWARP